MPIGTTRELSLRQRLLLLTMITNGIGVLLGCLCFLAYDMHVAKEHREEDLRSVADLIDTNSTPPSLLTMRLGRQKFWRRSAPEITSALVFSTGPTECILPPTSAPT